MTPAAHTAPAPRLPDWQLRLEALLHQHAATPFAWGRFDCVQFAAAAVQAVTGLHLLAAVRGYGTQWSALRTMRRHGAACVGDLAAAHLGQPIAPLQAQPGDIGLVQARPGCEVCGPEFGGALCVCVGGHWLTPGSQGLVIVPMHCVAAAWRVA